MFITDALQISQKYSKTAEYLVDTAEPDFRELVNVKNQPKKTTDSYIQMFDDKHGFISNLSILDLIFMEGPNAISYL